MRHSLKIASEFYRQVVSNEKTFEVRKNDRGFKVGDILELNEYVDGETTGRTVFRKVTSILEGYPGIEPVFCIMSIAPIETEEHDLVENNQYKKIISGKISSVVSYRSQNRKINESDDRYRVEVDLDRHGFYTLKRMLIEIKKDEDQTPS